MKRHLPWIIVAFCGIGLAQAGDFDNILRGLIKQKMQPAASSA